MKRKSDLPNDVLKVSNSTSSLLLFLIRVGLPSALVDMSTFRDYIWKQYTKRQKAAVEKAVKEGEMLCSTCGTEASWGGCDYKLCPEYKLLKARDEA